MHGDCGDGTVYGERRPGDGCEVAIAAIDEIGEDVSGDVVAYVETVSTFIGSDCQRIFVSIYRALQNGRQRAVAGHDAETLDGVHRGSAIGVEVVAVHGVDEATWLRL